MKSSEKYELVEILEGKPFQVRPRLKEFLEKVQVVEEAEVEEGRVRTSQQNNALWLFYQLVADELVKNGVTMRMIFEKTSSFDITPTKDSVHVLWLYFQKAMYGTSRTRDLKKSQGQIEKIHEVMMKNLGELFHIDYIKFPVDEEKENQKLKTIEKAKTMDYPEYNGPPSI